MTKRARNLIAPALTLLLVLAFPLAAQASPKQVIKDCAEDGAIDGKYSNADLKAALKKIPADLDEYSDCRAAISSAIGPSAGASGNKSRGGGGSGAGAGGSGGGSTGAPDPDTNGDGKVSAQEKKAAAATVVALKRNDKRQKTEQALGKRKIDPARAGAIAASETNNGLPLPVILAIAALALLAIAAVLLLVGRRRPGFAQVLRRVPVPGRSRS